ncbi:alpha/beta hydrolase family esterase [Caenispirillum salinarum]|uniref:alpha/beta hydrolase family esterase n=1 Tax=Caenispirillum salinarum TaxID=859058 RepID=UPI00384D87B1
MRMTAAALLLLLLPLPAVAASAGCGQSPPAAPPETVEAAGETREVLVAVPEDYDRDTPHRLVFGFHGRTTPAERVRRYYGLENAMAESAPTVFVYPTAARQDDDTFIWRVPEDLALFDMVVERLSADYCIDRTRIFAVGHSLGASFVNTLGCLRGEALRGIASVAGGIHARAEECRGDAAALLLHNRADRLVDVDRGRRARDVLVTANGLESAPAAFYPRPFGCYRYGPAEAHDPVAWCLYAESVNRRGRFYPHLWPDGAEEAMAAFFSVLP